MKLRIGIAILTIMSLLIGLCAATLTSTASTEIVGDIGDQIDVTPPSNTGSWNLISGVNTVDGTLVVSSNNLWGVNVKSDQSDGKMKEYSAGYVTGGKSLTNPMHVKMTNKDVPLTNQDQNLIDSGTSPVSIPPYAITFSQEVDPTYDTRINPPRRYHIVVTFTGFIQY
ncbi:MAG: hypothetical protein NTY37_11265 [Methanothrix sp.]|nr:hypothetical protein [Methanothrix sp.]